MTRSLASPRASTASTPRPSYRNNNYTNRPHQPSSTHLNFRGQTNNSWKSRMPTRPAYPAQQAYNKKNNQK